MENSSGTRIKIISAVYGAGTDSTVMNVTLFVQQLVNEGVFDITASNKTFGKDPAPHKQKMFGVLYHSPELNKGHPIALGCFENKSVHLLGKDVWSSEQNTLPSTTDLTVQGATYSGSSHGQNVTAMVQAFINLGNLAIPVNNSVFGPDPLPHETKVFSIIYKNNATGTVLAATAQENSTIILPL